MPDQAAGLRRLMGEGPRFQALGVFGTDAGLTAEASAQLAHALARRGAPVWVLDEAPAPRNVATRFGMHVRLTLDRALAGEGEATDAALQAMPGVHLLAVRGGMAWLARLPERRWSLAVEALSALPEQPQWLILHAEPGREPDSLALCAPDRLLVLPQRKTALTEAYALLKTVQRLHPAERWLVLVMQAHDEDAARQTHAALAGTARRFLGIELAWLGEVPREGGLSDVARRMQPVQDLPAGTPGSKAFRQIAETAAERLVRSGMYKPDEFWLKMWMFSRLTAEAALEKVRDVQLRRSLG